MKSILGLSLSLSKANFKLKNEGSYLGVIWYLLNPLFLFLIILSVRNSFRVEEVDFFPIYLLTGLIMFNFFKQATKMSTTSLSSNEEFLKNMKVSYFSIVISYILQVVFSHFFELILLGIFMSIMDVPLIGIILYIPIFVLFTFFVLGIGFILSSLGLIISDLRNVWDVVLSLLFFMTPIFYVVSEANSFLKFNPLTYFLSLARKAIIGGQLMSFSEASILLLLSGFVLVSGVLVFIKYKGRFAELV